MGKIGRNAPCPCESGKKYKRCCLPLQESAASSPPPKAEPVARAPHGETFYEDDIDQLSNAVVDLLKEGELDQAETLCKKLSAVYPDQVDGLERMAQVQEARGNRPLAEEYYRKAAAFVKGKPGFDQEFENWLLEQANNLEKKTNAS